MGLSLSQLYSWIPLPWKAQQDLRVLMLGLDSAGKTTILYKLKVGEVVSTVPTIGFNVESLKIGNIECSVWDLGGQSSIRPYWRCYFPNTAAIVYVMDSSDRDRIETSRAELLTMLNEEELRGVPLLVFANKQDAPNPMKPAEVIEGLELAGPDNPREWTVLPSCAIKGEGLMDGFKWLTEKITKK